MKVFSVILLAWTCSAQEYTFPNDFKFGLATASYQIEGAWNFSGKGENIWDRLVHNTSLIVDKSNGDIACDAYSKTKEDVQLLKNVGVDYYRFSISWSRLLPSGFNDKINSDGVRYYNELIDELIANDIVPLVTMYHWDLPQPLQEIGGWPNPLMVDYFRDYADVLFKLFGDRVKNWITFNEPIQICYAGYSVAEKAPAYTSDGIACYLCGHTLLLAHAKTYRLYDEYYREKQGGRVGITVDTSWSEPASQSEEDIEAAETKMQMQYGWYVHPIYSVNGDYPEIMKQRIRDMSISEGFSRSRLPEFSPEEIAYVRGTADFLGLNHYTSAKCYPADDSAGTQPSLWRDIGVECYYDSEWESAESSWLKVVPWGLRKLLNWIKNEYNNPEVIITENGFSDTGEIQDCRRVHYYNAYLTELLKAIVTDGCNVTGYMAWSFMDNFEWLAGYTERFGLYHVDFEDPSRPRTPKMSAFVYKKILESKKIDWNYTPENFEPCQW